MSRVIYDGYIDGEFEGFDDEVLFKMRNGTYWLQAQYKYWYHYTYAPKATVTEENGKYILTVAGNSISVIRVTDVIESSIDGEFKGWEGETEYTLQNGQVWKQATYMHTYTFTVMPEAIVYSTGGGHKMRVAGTVADVRRVK